MCAIKAYIHASVLFISSGKTIFFNFKIFFFVHHIMKKVIVELKRHMHALHFYVGHFMCSLHTCIHIY